MDDLKHRQIITTRTAFAISTIHWMCFAIEVSILAFVAKDLAINDVHYGYVITMSSLAQLVTSPLYSHWAGANLRKAVAIAFISTSSSYLLTALASGFWILMLSRVAAAFGHAMVAAQTAVAACSKPEERTAAFGKLGATFGVGFMTGSAVGGIMARSIGLRLPLYMASAICAVTALVGPWFIKIDRKKDDVKSDKKPDQPASQGLRGYLRLLSHGKVATISLARILAFTPMNTMLTIFGVYLIEQFKTDPGSNATMMIYLGLCMTVMNAGGIGMLKKFLHDRGLLYLGIASFALTAVGITMVQSYYQFFFVLATLSMGLAIVGSSTDSMLTSSVEESDHALVLSLTWAIDSLTRVIGPTFGGFMLSRYGFASFGYSELITVTGAATLVYLFL